MNKIRGSDIHQIQKMQLMNIVNNTSSTVEVPLSKRGEKKKEYVVLDATSDECEYIFLR